MVHGKTSCVHGISTFLYPQHTIEKHGQNLEHGFIYIGELMNDKCISPAEAGLAALSGKDGNDQIHGRFCMTIPGNA